MGRVAGFLSALALALPAASILTGCSTPSVSTKSWINVPSFIRVNWTGCPLHVTDATVIPLPAVAPVPAVALVRSRTHSFRPAATNLTVAVLSPAISLFASVMVRRKT